MRARDVDPLTIDVPERLDAGPTTLRPPAPGDGTALAEAVAESDAALRPWFHADMAPPEREADPRWQEAVAARHRARFAARERLPYLAWDGVEAVAFVELRPDWRTGRMRLAYWVRASRHREGIARATVGAVIAMAFDALDARVVTTGHAEPNHASAALIASLGFTPIARQPMAHEMPDGELVDGLAYALWPGVG